MSTKNAVLRTFRLHDQLMVDLKDFMIRHPEIGSLNHLVEVALTEFVEIHKKDKTWLKGIDER